MSTQQQANVKPIPGPGRMHATEAGQVFHGEFEGHPFVSIFDPTVKKGAVCKLNKGHLDIDFARWLDAAKREFNTTSLNRLQIKFICVNKDEATLKDLCAKNQVSTQAIAAVEESARLEVFFFTDAGRLRIAPSSKTFRETSRSFNNWKTSRKARVLIVDDSKTMRSLLRMILTASPELEVVGEAERPSQVEELIAKLQPDVMTLDINMPEMSGVELLKKILSYRFLPTVMISSLNMDEGREVINALELGAVDYIHKPANNEIGMMTPIIQEKILNAARVRHQGFGERLSQGDRALTARAGSSFKSSGLLAIGASTGGTEAIKSIFLNFPAETPPIVVVQHIPPYFSTAFANRLNEICKFEVKEAVDGDEVRPGRALIAPGGLQMEIRKEGTRLVAHVFDGEPVNRFKPSVDVLFNSVAKFANKSTTGVLLTGMGADGARGLLALKNAGALTIAQDEESCVVYGMPRAAVEMGAASVVESLTDIPHTLLGLKAA